MLMAMAARGLPLELWGRGFESHSKACMSVCVYSVFVLSCVQVAALRRADPPSKDYETEKAATIQQRAVEPLMNEW
jgi:hypothetical protein